MIQRFILNFMALALACIIQPLNATSPHKHSKRHHKQCKRTKIVTLDLADSFGNPLGLPFNIHVSYEINNDIINIYIPAFNFSLPADTPGFVYTQDNFLPRNIWPNDPAYQVFFESTDNGANAKVNITNAGSLLFVALQDLFFTPGAHAINAITATYKLSGSICDFKPPKNIRVSTDSSNTTITTNPFDYLENHDISLVNNKFAVWWPDNSVALAKTANRNHMNVAVRTGAITYDDKGDPHVNFDGPPSIAISAEDIAAAEGFSDGIFFVEGAIAINPINQNNIAVSVQAIDMNWYEKMLAGDPEGQKNFLPIWIAVSHNGGVSWQTRRIDGAEIALYPFDGSRMQFDTFGNLWFIDIYASQGAYLTDSFTNDQGFSDLLILSVSTDGGDSFTTVDTVKVPVPVDVTTQTFNLFDYPRITFGGDGEGHYVAYATYTRYLSNNDGTGDVYQGLAYIPITKLGSFGNLKALKIPQTELTQITTDQNIETSEIAAGSNGNIMIMGLGYPFCCLSPNNIIQAVSNPTGIQNFDEANNTTGNAFSGPYTVAKSNVGLFNYLTITPYQPNRGVPQWSQGAVYDEETNRFYIGVIDMQPLNSSNMVLYLLYTADNGKTWSKPVLIADKIKAARGNLDISQDPVTGNVLFRWLDARDQGDQANVNTYMAVMTKSNSPLFLNDIA